MSLYDKIPFQLGVSIRSPHRSEGRPGTATVELEGHLPFQSAPLTGARGDAGCRNQPTIRKLYRYLRESVKWLSIKSD